MKDHIHREDHVFYPLAEKTFSEVELSQLTENFKKADEKFEKDFFAKNENMVQKLELLLKDQFGE